MSTPPRQAPVPSPSPFHRRAGLRLWPAALALAVLGACSSYSPSGLKPGASPGDAEKSMGPRTATYPLPGGGQRLEFARGPAGKHTYMLDFDAQGRLLHWEDVMTEAHFARLKPQSTQAEVLSQIGHPAETMRTGHGRWWQTVWSYRYTRNECLWFQVSFDPQGEMVGGSYGTDPSCDRLELH
jgi:hypothetical protein